MLRRPAAATVTDPRFATQISLNGAQETFDRVKFVYKDRISDRVCQDWSPALGSCCVCLQNELVWKVFLAVANVLLLIAILVVLGVRFCSLLHRLSLLSLS